MARSPRPETRAEGGKTEAPADPVLVRVEKDGVVLDIHPEALAQHLNRGWREA